MSAYVLYYYDTSWESSTYTNIAIYLDKDKAEADLRGITESLGKLAEKFNELDRDSDKLYDASGTIRQKNYRAKADQMFEQMSEEREKFAKDFILVSEIYGLQALGSSIPIENWDCFGIEELPLRGE
jgi:hypothetical protein